MWNLKYSTNGLFLQSRNKLTIIEKKRMVTKKETGGGMNWE